MDIEKNIQIFQTGFGKDPGRGPELRYASFDYCFNYFQRFREEGRTQELAYDRNMQESCLQLAYYLASWGMFRGKSFLLTKVSLPAFKELIRVVADTPQLAWNIDADSYNSENIGFLLDLAKKIRLSLHYQNDYPTDILITKIMLGVFGSVPAFDTNFNKGFGNCSMSRTSLIRISEFYRKNQNRIDKVQIFTYDFATGQETKRLYTKAKIIDMICFIEGVRKANGGSCMLK